jgi:hypothetical protein
VDREDYEELDLTAEAVVAALSVLLLGPVGLAVALPAVMWALQDICDYLMGGKHVCLGAFECAIGRIAEFEPVGFEKPFPENIDNDFSINLLLAPHSLGQFTRGIDQATKRANWEHVANDGIQGHLIREQSGMPDPREPADGWGKYAAYFTEFLAPNFGDPIVFPTSADPPIHVPILHCECEGSRIHDVCSVLSSISSLGSGICDFEVLGIPIGKAVCAIVGAALSPIIAAAIAVAWATADDGTPDPARLDPESGTLDLGDCIVVTGRWIYDAGHGGYNEIHAVRTIQKIPDSCDWAGFEALHARWCQRVEEVPPRPADPVKKPHGMTPAQEAVYTSQVQPENRWFLHPLIDGCEPEKTDEEPIIK